MHPCENCFQISIPINHIAVPTLELVGALRDKSAYAQSGCIHWGLKAGTAINFIALYIGVVVSLLLGKTVSLGQIWWTIHKFCFCDSRVRWPWIWTSYCIKNHWACYLFVKRLQEPVRQWLDSGNFPLAQRALQCLEEADDSFQILILFRFLLVPIWMRNYAPSTLRFPLWKLLVSAIPHTLWASFVLASLGTSLQDVEEVFTHDSHFKLSNVKWQNIAMFIVSCLTAVLISLYSYKKYSELTSGESTPLLEHGRKEPWQGEQLPLSSENETSWPPLNRNFVQSISKVPERKLSAFAPKGLKKLCYKCCGVLYLEASPERNHLWNSNSLCWFLFDSMSLPGSCATKRLKPPTSFAE